MEPAVQITGPYSAVDRAWYAQLGGDFVDTIHLPSQREAKVAFEQNQRDIVLVAMNAYPGERYSDPKQLTRWFRQRFQGPILSFSNSDDFAKRLLAEGATDWALTDEVPEKIKEMLREILVPLKIRLNC